MAEQIRSGKEGGSVTSNTPTLERWINRIHQGDCLEIMARLPAKSVGVVVSHHGWEDAKGRLSFRHTIWGETNRGFRVLDQDNRIHVVHGDISHVSWSRDVLVVTASSKLRNTVLVAGKVSRRQGKRYVEFKDSYLLADFKPSAFINGLSEGWIAIDFDAREQSPGSKGFRNHGTKFRVKHQDMQRMFERVEHLT